MNVYEREICGSWVKRYLESIALSSEFSRQMRFISGPRQTGKTTLAKKKLQESYTEQLYYNWDRKEVRNRYRSEIDFIAADIIDIPKRDDIWVCFDEIHKMPKWKNILTSYALFLDVRNVTLSITKSYEKHGAI